MDEGLSKAVLEVFVTLYKERPDLQGQALVNWDPKLLIASPTLRSNSRRSTATSGISATPSRARFWIRKILKPSSPWRRPARRRCWAIWRSAVHPDDERFRHLVGKNLILCRSSAAGSRWWRTSILIRRKAAARSRSRRRTTSTNLRSAGAISCRRSIFSP
ncbi:hypothetical protein [Mesorhizobium sp. M0208]|uniref:hypothetical protein n=1 Tax=Mesorhizobium sp. M0208 TaxID=2956916 RepID=UPI00333D4AE0